jgi:hypothetical protein
MESETKRRILDIQVGCETHFDLGCHTLVGERNTSKYQKCYKKHVLNYNYITEGLVNAFISQNLYRLANCRLKCAGILNQVEFGHLKVFENKTEELPLLFALKLFQIMFLEGDFPQLLG